MRSMIAAAALVLMTAPAWADQKLVLYTSQPDKDAAQTVSAFKDAHPDVQVEVFRSGTTEIMGRLAAEFAAGKPHADVLLIADSVSMETLKKDGKLFAYKDAKLNGLRPETYDPDRTYFGTKLITTGIAYRKDDAAPTSWADLAKPEMKDKVVMPSPLYSGAAAIMMGALTERPEFGWKYYEALKANGAVAVQGNGAVLQAVSSGDKPYGVLVDFMALNAKAKGAPVDFAVPKEGVIPVTEPVAILNGSPDLDAAKEFVDFVLSPQGQTFAVQRLGYIPARSGVPNPPWLPAGSEINLMKLDNQAILQNAAADKARFANLFGG